MTAIIKSMLTHEKIKNYYNKLHDNNSFMHLKLIQQQLNDLKHTGFHPELPFEHFTAAAAEIIITITKFREYAEIYNLLDTPEYLEVEDFMNKVSVMDPTKTISNN